MINKVIILEGSEDLTFIKWLIIKLNINTPTSLEIIEVQGKPQFKPYIKRHIINCVNDETNQINYSNMDIKNILLIKDFDLDDSPNEYKEEKLELEKLDINFDKYYISGTEPAPCTLETLFIENDGELLREFVQLIKEFNKQRQQCGKDYFEKVNDKCLFHEFFRFVGKKSKLNDKFFDDIFYDKEFSKYPDIKNLVNRIQRFIEE